MSYPGGKGGSGVAQAIINQIPPHDIYIEPFLGSGVIMRTKKPAAKSYGCDADPDVIARWSADSEWEAPPFSTILNVDAISFLGRFFDGRPRTDREFIYIDPPYLFDVRSSKDPIYAHEFGTPEQHEALLDLLKTIPAHVAISGYYSDLYAQKLADWRTITFNTIDRGGNIKQEWLWMNYSEPQQLHDYRFLGKDYRERERLAKMRRRWLARLTDMPRLERLMLSAAIAENDVASTTEADDGRRDHIATNGGTEGEAAANHAGNDGALEAAGIATSIGATR